MDKLLNEINGQLMRLSKLVKKECAVDSSIIPSANYPVKYVDIEVVPEDHKEDDESVP